MTTRPDVRNEELRAPVREDDPRARAAARAAEIMGDIDDMIDEPDKFAIDKRVVPDGWDYEWKTFTVLNKEDPAYQVQLARTGWEPVPKSRHPEMMPKGWKGQTIDREGMILMQRPTVITDKIKARDRARAREQVRIKEQQLSSAPKVNGVDTFERVDGSRNPTARVSRHFEPMPIPEE